MVELSVGQMVVRTVGRWAYHWVAWMVGSSVAHWAAKLDKMWVVSSVVPKGLSRAAVTVDCWAGATVGLMTEC
ncbi:hypothetical protein B7Y94_06090 [Candidatus Saccharibacteria bacterium 32-49-12]|nr:MAG: hypothetical protein B7Y94_06090 [Candidatus Saccharibacteria bacterium 32-49-12]